MNIIVLQHIKIEDPGYIKDLMLADGIDLTTIELDEGEKIPKDLSKFDGMFCMGGPMVIYGFYLGEKWIKIPDMRILGVTWVIISMKLLYGLMLDFHHWGWISASQLVGALLFSVW